MQFRHFRRDQFLIDKVADVHCVKGNDRGQQTDAADERVDDEFDRGILSPTAAPHADEEVHRQQHHFKKDVEEEQIE